MAALTLTHCVVDLTSRRVERADGGSVRLTTREAELMTYLAQATDRDVPREELLTEVWGYAASSRTRAVDSTMTRLRRKVERAPSDPDHLLSVTGVGYRFVLGEGRVSEPAPVAAEPSFSAQPIPVRHDVFVGREAELEELSNRLKPGRLTTLVGVGGIGKSRLAVRTAQQWVEQGREVRWLRLDGALTLADVGVRLAHAMGIAEPPDDRAAMRLFDSAPDALWVFDDADGCLDTLLAFSEELRLRVPRVAWLVTARRPLGLPGERVIHLSRMSEADAKELFCERADLAHTSGSLQELVDALDGHPLAIELAAARAHALGVDALLRSSRSWLELLADRRSQRPARHASLRTALDASWDALGPAAQRLLMQLSDLACAADLSLVESISGPEGLDALEELAEHSLLVRGGGVWGMSNVVRAYGRARLDAHEEQAEIRRAMVDATLAAARVHYDGVRGADIARHLEALVLVHPELERIQRTSANPEQAAEAFVLMGPAMLTCGVDGRRAAVKLALEQPLSPAWRAKVCALSSRLMQTREPSRELTAQNRKLVEEAIALAEQEDLPDVLAVAYRLSGMFHLHDRDHEAAAAGMEASVAAARRAGHADEEAMSLALHAFVDVRLGRPFDSRLLRALRVAGRAGAFWAESVISSWYADLLDNAGRGEEAHPHAVSALEVFEQLGDWSRAAWMGVRLVAVWRQQGEHARAEEWLERALNTHLSDPYNTWHLTAMSHRAAVALEAGDLAMAREHAERVLETAQRVPMPISEANGYLLLSWVALIGGQIELAKAHGALALEIAQQHATGSHRVTFTGGAVLAAAWAGDPVEVPRPDGGMTRVLNEQGVVAMLAALLSGDEEALEQWRTTVRGSVASKDRRVLADLAAIEALAAGEIPTQGAGGWVARLCVERAR